MLETLKELIVWELKLKKKIAATIPVFYIKNFLFLPQKKHQ